MEASKHIIFAEDDRVAAKIFCQKFENAGYEVTVAHDGQTAMEVMATHPPDLVFLDLALPDIDGVAILHFIRDTERIRNVPVFILSDSDHLSPEVQEAWSGGATLFFKKNRTNLDDLLAIVGDHFGNLSPPEAEPYPPGKVESEDRKTVLITDDDTMIHRVLKHFLNQAGFNVIQAFEGREAIELAATARPDIMILDRVMPGMDGMEVMEEWGANPALREIPVIMLSSDTDLPMTRDGLAPGLVQYIYKPFSEEHIVDAIRRELGLAT